MALFHSTTKVISRSKGRSSVAAAAYRSGEKIKNERDGITHDFTHKGGVVYSEIVLPENAPERYKDRSILWNEVEQKENRKDAQTAREVELALPVELNRAEQIQLLQDYVKENFVDRGMIADFSIHAGHGHDKSREHEQDSDIKTENPHAHIMLTMREVTPAGFGNKNREWNDNANVIEWRKDWAERCNREYEKKSLDLRIDHRSYAEQGVEREPTIHMGAAFKLEQRGIQTEKGDFNRGVEQGNAAYQKGLEVLQREITDLRQQRAAPTAQEIVGRLNEIELQSQRLAVESQRLQQQRWDWRAAVERVEGAEERSQKARQRVERYDKQLGQLQEERGQLGLFAGKQKRELDSKIERLQQIREQAVWTYQQDRAEYEQLKGQQSQRPEPVGNHQREQEIGRQLEQLKEEYIALNRQADRRPDGAEIRERHRAGRNALQGKERPQTVKEDLAAAKARVDLHNSLLPPGRGRVRERDRGLER